MCNKLKRRSWGLERSKEKRNLRLGLSLGNTRVVQVNHNFRNKRGMHHRLLVHLHLETDVSIIVRICKTLRLDQTSPKVVWQGGSWALVCGRCGTTLVIVVMLIRVVSNVVNKGTTWKSVPRIRRAVEIRALEPNLHHLIPQIGLHLEEPLLVLADGQTVSMQSLATKSKKTLQLLSWV